MHPSRYLKLPFAVLLAFALIPAANATNVSILYGWNGTNFVPVQVTSDGSLKTDLNLTESTGLNPQANNTFDIGSTTLLWANIYARSLRGHSLLSLFAGTTEAITILGSGNVGIGITSPTSLLHVAGNANVTGTVYGTFVGDGANLTNTGVNTTLNYGHNGTNWVPLLTMADGTLKLNMRDAQSTNASNLLSGATGTDLTLSGTLTAGGINVTGRQIADNTTLAALLGQKLNLTGGTLSGLLTGTFGTFANGLNVTAGGLIVAAGNVGIGTTSPAQILDIRAASNPRLHITETTNSVTAKLTASDSQAMVGTVTNHPFVIRTNDTDRVTFDTSGNVGIGTTGPSAILHTKSAATGATAITNARANAGAFIEGNSGSSWGIALGNINTVETNYIQSMDRAQTTTNSLNLNPYGGNVGIGTTGPGGKLEIVEGTTTPGTYDVLKVKTSSTADVAPRFLIEGNRNSVVQQAAILLEVAASNVQKLRFQVDDTSGTLQDRLAIDSAGNVGIGTTGPTAKLEVIGNLAVNGAPFGTDVFGTIHFLSGTNYGLYMDDDSTGGVTGYPVTFTRGASNAVVGRIATTTTTTEYQTSSDRRLKENIIPTTAGLDVLSQITVNDYNFIADPSKTMQGFIAQDLYNYYPYAVSVGGENPQENPWGVDYGRLTPLIVKSVQELDQRTTGLQTTGQGDLTIAGNVGIGTTNPGKPLHVVGDANITGDLHGTFRGVRAGITAAQSVASGIWTKITLNTTTFDSHGEFDTTTNNRYTPTVAGYYQCTASAHMDGVSDLSASAAFYKNGVRYAEQSIRSVPTQLNPVVTDIVYLDGDDYVELYALHNRGSNLNVLSNSELTFLSCFRIGS